MDDNDSFLRSISHLRSHFRSGEAAFGSSATAGVTSGPLDAGNQSQSIEPQEAAEARGGKGSSGKVSSWKRVKDTVDNMVLASKLSNVEKENARLREQLGRLKAGFNVPSDGAGASAGSGKAFAAPTSPVRASSNASLEEVTAQLKNQKVARAKLASEKDRISTRCKELERKVDEGRKEGEEKERRLGELRGDLKKVLAELDLKTAQLAGTKSSEGDKSGAVMKLKESFRLERDKVSCSWN